MSSVKHENSGLKIALAAWTPRLVGSEAISLREPMAGTRENPRSLAQIMADFTFGLSYDSIPSDVMAAARRHLADTVACALGARNTTAARALEKYAIGKGGRDDA